MTADPTRGVIIASQTLTAGGPAITASGTQFSLGVVPTTFTSPATTPVTGAQGVLVVGGSETYAIPDATATGAPSSGNGIQSAVWSVYSSKVAEITKTASAGGLNIGNIIYTAFGGDIKTATQSQIATGSSTPAGNFTISPGKASGNVGEGVMKKIGLMIGVMGLVGAVL